jgi:hypothetical protein
MLPDCVIPYRRSSSGELIYALRSLSNIKHGKVFIIGDNPKLDNIIYIPFQQTPNIAKNTLDIMNLACTHPDISENFIWMADDMFILKKLDKIPIHHRGIYSAITRIYTGPRSFNFYVTRMKVTQRFLESHGVKYPLCYELHIPFMINKSKWNKIAHLVKENYNKLSVYGNLNKIGGTKMNDVKIRKRDTLPSGNFVSTFDTTFGVTGAGELIRNKFSDRSIYER